MRLPLFILGFLISTGAFAQTLVKGVVYDRVGPIHGVVVAVQGVDSLNSVVTNSRGEFEIKTSNSNPVLSFTFVGLVTKTIVVKNKTPLRVKMKFDIKRYQPIEKY